MNFSITMDDDLKLEIDQAASTENRSRSNFIEVACREYLDKKKEKKTIEISGEKNNNAGPNNY